MLLYFQIANIVNIIVGKRKLLKYEARYSLLKSKISKRIFQVMMRKQTNLCVELLSSKPDLVFDIADQIGPYICILNIHIDTFSQFDEEKASKLKHIALKHDFLILDDR